MVKTPPYRNPDGFKKKLPEIWHIIVYSVARFKFRDVSTELINDNWIRNLHEVRTPIQLVEFILLFMALSSVSLNDQKDSITWKWNADEKNSVASPYNCQFFGPMAFFLTFYHMECNLRAKMQIF
jgi:hypothetical protein